MTAEEPQPAPMLGVAERLHLDRLAADLGADRAALGAIRDETRDHTTASELDLIINCLSEAHDRTRAVVAWLRRTAGVTPEDDQPTVTHEEDQ